MLKALTKCRVGHRYLTIIRHINIQQRENICEAAFKIVIRQGDVISPKLFIPLLEHMFKQIDFRYKT